MDECPFCDSILHDETPVVTLTQKGIDGIINSGKIRGENVPSLYIGQKVHTNCRRDFCDIKRMKRSLENSAPLLNPKRVSLRSSEIPQFDFKTSCIYCGHPDTYESKYKSGEKLILVRTLEMHSTVTNKCKSRSDEWAERVSRRISTINDLHAADAHYHRLCYNNFHSDREIPICFMSKQVIISERSKGKSKNETQAEAFRKVMIDFRENDDKNGGQMTIQDLIKEMKMYLSMTDLESYGFTYMKTSILKYFGDEIIIGEVGGRSNTVTFREMASTILLEHHTAMRNEQDPEEQKNQVIKSAVRFLKADIRTLTQSRTVYPDMIDLTVEKLMNYLPDTVRLLISKITPLSTSEFKIASLGHAIVQAVRPTSLLAPLQLGLAIQMHNQFASRFLIDSLYQHGFCSSYNEMQTFQRSVTVAAGVELSEGDITDDVCLQYSADNADHNTITLDGRSSFHGMGMIAMITPGQNRQLIIPRVKITDDDIRAVGSIEIKMCPKLVDGLRSSIYTKLTPVAYIDPHHHMETLWAASHRSGWSGVMQMAETGDYPGKSNFMFLPMIDMSPNDPNCVYSTLCFISTHAKRYGKVPIITSDQPVWWKMYTIIQNQGIHSDLRQIVLKLGVMHLSMSYLGSIGHNMDGTGIRQLLSIPYGENVVTHIMSGKAIDRARRAHQLLYMSLNILLEEKAVEQGIIDYIDINSTRLLCDQIIDENLDIDDIEAKTALTKYETALELIKTKLVEKSKTAKLWIQYMNQCNILRELNKAERTGDFLLHLKASNNALPIFAANGHNLYTKTLKIYLQNMDNLKTDNPSVFSHFMNGHHIVRRTDRYWAGISTDQIIEQMLMRALKTNGGLTRGRGFTEMQMLIWVLSRPVCCSINHSMQELTKVAYVTSDQHKESSKTRIVKDDNDVKDLVDYLRLHDPFDGDPSLRNIASGVTASNKVNADQTGEIGMKILQNMEGQNVLEYTFRKKDQLTNMNTNIIKIGNEKVSIDPQVLFQRFVCCGVNEEKLGEIFFHELCAFPASIFESKYVMRAPDKSGFVDVLWDFLPEICHKCVVPSPEDAKFVVDGGWLLHRIPWKRQQSYDCLADKYVTFMNSHYKDATIVFDSYPTAPQTKDATHLRRSAGPRSTDTRVEPNLKLDSNKDDFLSNSVNKQRFVNFLSRKLNLAGYTTLHAYADADRLICETTVDISWNQPVILIGSDSDLVILLLHFFPKHQSNRDVFYTPLTQENTKNVPKVWDIRTVQNELSDHVSDNILFTYAILGCDTTSRSFGLRKLAALKLLEKREYRDCAEIFSTTNSTTDSIIRAGERALMMLFGCIESDKNLNELRLRKFLEKASSSVTFIHPKTLPPTSDSAKYHIFRVFHQIQDWMGNELDPCKWGWFMKDNKFYPVMTKSAIAPHDLMQKVQCGCKGDCSTKSCSCRKLGLDCSVLCRNCHGECSNREMVVNDDNEDQ